MRFSSVKSILVCALIALFAVGCNSSSGGSSQDGRDTESPTKPSSVVQGEMTSSSVALSWPASTDNIGVSRYRIYRNGAMISETTGTSYTDASITDSTRYCYSVSALDEAGNESDKSQEACVDVIVDVEAPSVPTNLSIYSSQPDNTVQIKWTDSTDNVGVEGYKIYRNGAYIASSSTNTYMDSDVSSAGQYCYKISAFDSAGNESATETDACVNTSNGRVKWNYKTDLPITGSLALAADGTIYATDERYLYAVNPDGSLKWKYKPDEKIQEYSSPSIAPDGSICLATVNGIYVVKQDGIIKWRFETYRNYRNCMAVGLDGTLYASRSATFYAINPDGTLKWQSQYGGQSVTIDQEGTIYTLDSNLQSFSPDGTLKWQNRSCGHYPYTDVSAPVIGNKGNVLVSVHSKAIWGHQEYFNLYALNPDGTDSWRNSTDRLIGTPVFGPDGAIYLCSRYDIYPDKIMVSALNEDGTTRWKSDVNSYLINSLAVDAGGTVFAMSRDGYIKAIGNDGKLKWESQTGFSNCSPAIADDGTIYVVSDSDSICAVSSDSLGLVSGVWSRSLGDNSNSCSVMKKNQDSEPPSIPLNVTASAIASSMIQIDWEASADALNPVTGYKVFRNGEYLGLKGKGFTDTGLNYSTNYCYRISAVDAAGNESEKSVEVCATPQQPAEGVLKWKYKTPRYGSNSSHLPALGQDGSFVAYSGGSRFALNPDGSVKWSYMTNNGDNPALSIASDGTIYSQYGYAFYPDGSEKKLRSEMPLSGSTLSISSNGTLYFSENQAFWAINPDGSLKWKYQETNPDAEFNSFSQSSIASDGTVYAGNGYNIIYAFNPDGSVKWKHKSDLDIDSPLAIGPDGTVFTTVYGYGILAINPDGALKWQNSFDGINIYNLVVDEDGTIYSSGSSGFFYAISAEGQIKWKYSESETAYFESTLIGADGVLYVGAGKGYILAINPDGTLKWKYKAGSGAVTPHALAPDGALYFGLHGDSIVFPDYLCAIQTSSMGLATGGWPKIHHDNQNTGRMP